MTPDAARASHRNQIAQHGESISIRRYAGTPGARTSTDYATRGRVMDFTPAELAGNIKEGDRKLIVLVEDLEATAITLPLLLSDKIVARGKELAIVALDDNTRRIAGTLIAYELAVRG